MKSRKSGTNVYLATFVAGALGLGAITAIADGNSQASSVAQLSADWWQWTEEYPDVFAPGYVDCGMGQRGNVWFLAGSFGDTVERRCLDRVPAGKRLFFPLVNAAWFNEGEEDLTVAEKRAVLDGILSDLEPGLINSTACALQATVDGEPVIFEGTAIQRVQSPPFQYSGDPEAVSDGFWVLLPPLSGGAHSVQFAGNYCDLDTGEPAFEGFAPDVTYLLEVTRN